MDQGDTSYSEPIHESMFIFGFKIFLLQLLIWLLGATATGAVLLFVPAGDPPMAQLAALGAVAIVLQILNAAALIYLVLQWRNTSYVITPQEIIIRRGTAKVQTRIYKTDDIKTVEVSQSVLGKIFDYGTLVFADPSSKLEIKIQDIPHPSFVANLIRHAKFYTEKQS